MFPGHEWHEWALLIANVVALVVHVINLVDAIEDALLRRVLGNGNRRLLAARNVAGEAALLLCQLVLTGVAIYLLSLPPPPGAPVLAWALLAIASVLMSWSITNRLVRNYVRKHAIDHQATRAAAGQSPLPLEE